MKLNFNYAVKYAVKKNNNHQFSAIFVIISSLFVMCLLISNVIAGKLISLWGIILPAGAILFPITYIFGDILTEVYGFKKSRLIIWIGLAANIFMALVFTAVIKLPYPSFWKEQTAYATVLGMTPKLVIASLIAYFVGEFCNSALLSKVKVITNGKWLWFRTIGSTAIGEGVDTVIFISITFGGIVPNSILLQMIIMQYLFKLIYEIICTPLTYIIVGWMKKKEGVDTFDRNVKYNPFSLEI